MLKLPKPRRIVDRKYREFVKNRGCVLTLPEKEMACSSVDIIDAHHVKPVGGGIMGSKVSDRRCVGLCRLHHQMAENYPVSYRDILEAAIRRLNKEYDSLFPAKAKRERKTSARVRKIEIECECNQTHKIPASKAGLDICGIYYHCPFLKRDLVASFRRSV